MLFGAKEENLLDFPSDLSEERPSICDQDGRELAAIAFRRRAPGENLELLLRTLVLIHWMTSSCMGSREEMVMVHVSQATKIAETVFQIYPSPLSAPKTTNIHVTHFARSMPSQLLTIPLVMGKKGMLLSIRCDGLRSSILAVPSAGIEVTCGGNRFAEVGDLAIVADAAGDAGLCGLGAEEES